MDTYWLSFKKESKLLSKNYYFQIIWDEQNKRWINKDQDEDEKESFKPPPKMAQLPEMTQTSNSSSKIPNIPAAEQQMQLYGSPTLPTPNIQEGNTNSNNESIPAAKTPSLQSNMFKMQRNKSKDKSN